MWIVYSVVAMIVFSMFLSMIAEPPPRHPANELRPETARRRAA